MRLWSDEEHAELIRLRELGLTYKEIADKLESKFNRAFTFDSVRNRIRRTEEDTEEEIPNYKETIEIDGCTHKSDKLIRMTSEQSKDTNYLLKAHGYDPNKWEIITAKSSIWNQHNKKDGTVTLYSSKITVKPRENGFNFDDFLNKVGKVPQIYIDRLNELTNHYLNIPLFDMHFPISDYNYYKPIQKKILIKLDKPYKEILIIIGQDLLHNDDFRGRTSSGREIEKVDMVKAWNDAALFYEPIIQKAIKHSDKTKIMYSKGNHDESMSWAFVQYLMARFPQVTFDDSFRERKVHMLGLNFIGVNHGDKKKEQNLTENFATEFPIEWSKAKTREIFVGHLHHERVLDKGGVTIRRMPTGNKIDDYHEDRGYTTAHKRFQLFEYSEEALETIYYV